MAVKLFAFPNHVSSLRVVIGYVNRGEVDLNLIQLTVLDVREQGARRIREQ